MRSLLIILFGSASLAAPAFAQSSFTPDLDPRAGDTTVAPVDPGDRYGSGSGDYTDLGRVRPHGAELGAKNPFEQTIGGAIGGTIGSTIGPH